MLITKFFKYSTDYIYQNIIYPKILNFRYKNILKKNITLKNSKKGKRCFIIGGGPSVKELDLSKLKNEETFVVNEFDKNEQYQALNPKNHIMIDTAYFNPEHYLNEQFIKKTAKINKRTNVFLNIKAKNFIEKNKLLLNHKKKFIGAQGIFSDKFDFNIEIDKVVPYVKNSILMCLMIAVYMGFEKIYLLGCEHNFLCTNISAKNLTYDHSYKDGMENIDATDPKNTKRYMNERDINLTYEHQIVRVRQLFKNYRLFYGKIKKTKPQVEIFNATPDSFLDIFSFIKFENIKF